jgi:L-iditol 2-dehydrogenase
MKKAVIKGEKKVSLTDVPMPAAVGDWALVRVVSAPMCTEYKAYRDGEVTDFLGHEAAGEVVEVDRPGPVRVGDRVVVMPQYPCGECSLCSRGEYIHCQNTIDFDAYIGSPEGKATYAHYLLKPSSLLPKIPEAMSYDHASMLCCGLGPTFGAMERMGGSGAHTLLITGMGPVGLGGVANGVFRGCRVIAVTHHDYRSRLAGSLGADVVLDQHDPEIMNHILDLTGGNGVDLSIDCAGSAEAQRLCIEATRRLGQVAFVGESGGLEIKISDDLIRNGLTLHGVWHYNRNDIPKLFRIVRERNDLIVKMITHTFPLGRVEEAFELQLTRQCGKVILHPWDED